MYFYIDIQFWPFEDHGVSLLYVRYILMTPPLCLYIVINEQLPKIGERSKTLSDFLPKHSFKLIVVRNLVSEMKVLRKYVSFNSFYELAVSPQRERGCFMICIIIRAPMYLPMICSVIICLTIPYVWPISI